jgi:DNA-directed RNA polymerase subunit N (RpoN/RPB10)
MIIPIRCFTCGKVIADKWEYYIKRCEELENDEKNKDNKYFKEPFKEKILDELQLHKYCCRRMILSHVDVVDNL